MKTICYFAIACLILCVGPAKANWQYTKWGMTPEELLALGNGKIVKASPGEASPNLTEYKGHRGTMMALNAESVLGSGLLIEGISYKAFYYFNATGLFLVALIPSAEYGFRTSKLLDATYGAADREERLGMDDADDVGGCIVRRRWRAPQDGNLVTFFNLCGARFELRYEAIPAKSGL